MGPLSSNASNDRNLGVNRPYESLDDGRLLLRREKGAFSSVTEYNEALNTVNAAEPGA